jgi:hypothetical protein
MGYELEMSPKPKEWTAGKPKDEPICEYHGAHCPHTLTPNRKAKLSESLRVFIGAAIMCFFGVPMTLFCMWWWLTYVFLH